MTYQEMCERARTAKNPALEVYSGGCCFEIGGFMIEQYCEKIIENFKQMCKLHNAIPYVYLDSMKSGWFNKTYRYTLKFSMTVDNKEKCKMFSSSVKEMIYRMVS
jgi:hypothetical protein